MPRKTEVVEEGHCGMEREGEVVGKKMDGDAVGSYS